VFGAQSMTFYAALAWLPSILSDHGRSAAEAGALLALTSLVSAAPALWVPAFAARARTQVPVMLIVVALPLTGLAGLLAFPALDLAWVVLIGLGQGGVLGLCLMLPALRADDPVVVASLNSMMLTFGFVLAAAGPWLLGIVHDVTGSWRAALVALLIMTVAELLPGLPATRARTLA
jgi:CP family cyanate transporter-like MFS transporter